MKQQSRIPIIAAVLALALLGASCGKDKKKTPETTVAATETTAASETTAGGAPETTAASTETTGATDTTAVAGATPAGAQTVTVQVDAKGDKFPISATAYFPKEMSVHAGDTVTFHAVFSGEPHTVTFGTLVDAGVPKLSPTSQDEPAELKKIPRLIPNGPGDAIQAAAQPCFLASGDPPAADACTADQQKQPDFDGTQSYYNSGFLPEGADFPVKLSANIKPGTYNYFCTLHRGGMLGKITVVGADGKADSPDEATARGQKELSDSLAKLDGAYADLKKGVLQPFAPTAAPGNAIGGSGAQDVQNIAIDAFGPEPITVKAGDTVSWTILGPHTVTFGATEALRTFIAKAPDGAVHLNPDSFAPAGGAGQPQPPAPPPTEAGATTVAPTTVAGPPPKPIEIDGGTYDGTGLHNSGLVLSFPPQLFTYKLKFTKAGSYSYNCLIHPDMKGTVNVG